MDKPLLYRMRYFVLLFILYMRQHSLTKSKKIILTKSKNFELFEKIEYHDRNKMDVAKLDKISRESYNSSDRRLRI